MENNKSVVEYENKRLEQTITLAKEQLAQAKAQNENNKEAIIAAKQDLRENSAHSIGNLWGSEDFEALAALSQYTNHITDKIVDYEEVENKIALLKNMIQSPYFARIDFRFDDEDTFEEIYIGRSSLMKNKVTDIYVYDWRSPIASIFYRFVMGEAFYDAPGGRITGEVNLKRQYEIVKSELEYFFDADIQIIDEFLRKLLSGNTSSKMKAIVETIQREQDIVIRDMENDLMMVQGVAGSGKTSIALHRAAYLMYQGLSSKLSAHNILIISPNTLFEQYISNVLPELGEDNVVSVVFEDMLASILKIKHIQSRNQFLENLILSSKSSDITKSSIEFKTSHQFMQILDRFIDDLPHQFIAFKDVYYEGKRIVTKEILKKKVLSGRDLIPLGKKLNLMEEYVLELVRESKNHRLSKLKEIQITEEIQKFTVINMESLYRELMNKKEYFYSLTKDLNLPDNIEDILIYTQENLYGQFLYYDDAIVLAYLALKINGTSDYKNIKQVVIDEAQDYYPLHFEIFNLIFKQSKYTVLGDINQTLEKSENLSLYKQIQKILNKKTSSLVTLNKSFRCTNEILNFSSKFLKQHTEIESFNRKGKEPKVCAKSDQQTLNDSIIEEANACLDQGYQSIGLICKTEKNAADLFRRLKDKVNVQLIKSETAAELNGIFIIPVYMSKGLEFDAVLICDADTENYHSEDDKKLLYIASTRALHRLNIFCQGEVSPLLS